MVEHDLASQLQRRRDLVVLERELSRQDREALDLLEPRALARAEDGSRGPCRAAARAEESKAVTELLQQISDLISGSDRDLDRIERTLTDGYAYALALEAERWRLEKRLAAAAQELPAGDLEGKGAELTSVSQRLDHNADELSSLRGRLAELRRYADSVRVQAATAV